LKRVGLDVKRSESFGCCLRRRAGLKREGEGRRKVLGNSDNLGSARRLRENALLCISNPGDKFERLGGRLKVLKKLTASRFS